MRNDQDSRDIEQGPHDLDVPGETKEERRTEANIGRARAEARAQAAEAGRLRAERERNEANVDRVQAEADRDRAESARNQAERQRAEAELLMSVLRHDLRNPLRALVASSELLLRSAAFHREEDKRTVEGIASTAARMGRMIEQLLDFAGLRHREGIPVARRRTDVHEVCREVIQEIQRIYPDRVVRLDVDGDGVGDWDSDRLAQVVHNLVTNALEYGARDRPVGVSAFDDGPGVALEVRNQGVALTPEAMRTMFDPFRRLSDKTPGLGLGLYIAQQIVFAHDGSIDVESSDAEGTTFIVRLPRRAERSRVAPAFDEKD